MFGWVSEFIGAAVLLLAENLDDVQTAFLINPESSDPTHSQLAKDHEKHLFHTLAAKLAQTAVLEIGKMMRESWHNDQTDVSLLMGCVKKHMIHPERSDWMDDIVLTWAKSNPDAVRKAADRGWLAENLRTHAHELRELAEKLLGGSREVIHYYRRLQEMEQGS